MKQIIFLCIFFCNFSYAFESIRDEFDPKKETLFPSILTVKEADSLFSEFMDLEAVPFGFLTEGCTQRAIVMSRYADKKSINMAKIYAEGTLVVRTDDKRFDPVEWKMHTAPVAYVKDGNDIVLKVFDPSLFKEPVSVEKWRAKMESWYKGPYYERGSYAEFKGKVTKHYFSSKFQFEALGKEQKKYGWLSKDLAESNKRLKGFLKLLQPGKLEPKVQEDLKGVQ